MNSSAPDFKRVATVSAAIIQKDGRHSLLTYSFLGGCLIIAAFFNPAEIILLLVGAAFFFVLGVARYLAEKYKRPILKVGSVQSKRAVPYTRIEGSFDYFIQVIGIQQFEFSLDGKSTSLQPENEFQVKVSADIFKRVHEGQPVMLLLSSTKTLLGLFLDDYDFVSYA